MESHFVDGHQQPQQQVDKAPRRRLELLTGRLHHALLAASSVVITLLLLEVTLRLFFPAPRQPQFMPDPILGVRHTPHQRVWVTNEAWEFGVWFTTNAHGAPDVERSIEKPEGTYRIAVLGDSMVEGSQVRQEERFVSLLERQLTEWVQTHVGWLRRVEVLNFGASSYGTTQEWLYYQSYVHHYAPDFVLVAVFPGNDIMNNSFALEIERAGRPEIRPFFYLNPESRLVQRQSQFYKNAFKHYLKAKGNHISGLRRVYRTVRNHSRLVSIGCQAYWRIRNAGTLSTSDDRQLQVYFEQYDAKLQQTSQEWQQAWDITSEILRRFAEEVTKDGAQFHVAIIPGSWEVEGGPRSLSSIPEKGTEYRYDWEFPSQRMTSVLKKNKLSFTNFLPAFQETSQKDAAPLFFHRDTHYTPAGHRVLAEGLLPLLQDQISHRMTSVSQ